MRAIYLLASLVGKQYCCPVSHPATLASKTSLALCQQSAGKYEEAMQEPTAASGGIVTNDPWDIEVWPYVHEHYAEMKTKSAKGCADRYFKDTNFKKFVGVVFFQNMIK